MKKLLTFSFLLITFFLGTQDIVAQNKGTHPGVIAKEKTHRLTQEFSLDGNQQSLVWRAFMAREKAKLEIENSSYSKKEIQQLYLKADESFQTSMEKYLSEEQYSKFKKIMKDYL
ncbi:MAG: hypothetical protein HKO81_08530 [Flavobacteriaceae bacterium]|nr:hypothetical protein [Bacteroidia bacterium]NNL16671.1 hypothetical protein [Flavobacteriaceae bacterium]